MNASSSVEGRRRGVDGPSSSNIIDNLRQPRPDKVYIYGKKACSSCDPIVGNAQI